MDVFDSGPGTPAIRLTLPPHPAEPASVGFPWLAMLAPVVGALVLWAVTGSAMALAFAALGPVVALGSLLDGRRQARRARRAGAARRADRLAELGIAIGERHHAERSGAWRATPPTRRRVAADSALDWREVRPGAVVLGSGPVPSALQVDGQPLDDDDRAVLERAARLEDAPVLASLDGGLGLVGAPPLVRAAARAILLQLAHRCRPGEVELELPTTPAWAWSMAVPHRGGGGALRVRFTEGGDAREPEGERSAPTAMVALATVVEELPAAIETVLVIESPRRALLEVRGSSAHRVAIVPELLGEPESAASAARLGAAARRERLGSGTARLPRRLALTELAHPSTWADDRSSLSAIVGATDTGPLELDLAARGPHAIVAGTTGSGKSEFLLAWIAAMAMSRGPDRVAFLLVDFKGGAAFEPVRGLPHVTGIVTDLDESEAERAVVSLRAELRHRESVLLAERARDIAELAAETVLPRLVIVIDEFQAMVERFPDLGAVVADIAARGRSLGMHLVLASQRPNGVVREQVSANCPIRISLRVLHPADSRATIGTDAAARLGAHTPGRGIADRGDGAVVEFQSARLDRHALDALRAAGLGVPPARRPWVDPLPARVSEQMLGAPQEWSSGIATDAIAIGLTDVPERQRHELAVWSPSHDGHLLVLGSPGSGRSTVLAAVARAAHARGIPTLRLHGSPSVQWDAVHDALSRIRAVDPVEGILLVDDLDVRFGQWPDEYRQAAMTALEEILRAGRARGFAVAASAGAAHRLPASIREAFSSTALLRHPSRGELAHAGGAGELWRAGEPPGAGQWRGHRAQFLDAEVPAAGPVPAPLAPLAFTPGVWAIVARSPRAMAEAVRAAGVDPMVLGGAGDAEARAALAAHAGQAGGPLVIVGDADAWAGAWALAALVRDASTVVVQGGARELRAIVPPAGTLPPLIDDPAAQCWMIPAVGPVRRVGWPAARN